jgi:hypothetical protein
MSVITRTAIFLPNMQTVLVIPYRHFGTTYLSHLQDMTDILSRNFAKDLPLFAA